MSTLRLARGSQVAYLLSLLLPMSTTARIISTISTNEHYFPGYWGGAETNTSGSRLEEEAEAFLTILSGRDKDLEEYLLSMLGEGALQQVVVGWFAPLFLPFVPVEGRRVRVRLRVCVCVCVCVCARSSVGQCAVQV